MNYTDRIDGFQIRDVTYIGLPPKDAPPMFDIVKWEPYSQPQQAVDMRTGEVKTVTEYCYSVARLVWDRKESCFDFRSVGLRWLETWPGANVKDMILKFCWEKEKELSKMED